MKRLRRGLSVIFSTMALASMVAFFVLPASAQTQSKGTAVDPIGSFNQTLKDSGLSETGAPEIEDSLGNVINAVLLLVGVATFALVIYAGALWILAAGDSGKVETSKKILTGSVIGLIIIFTAFITVNFVLRQLKAVTTNKAASVLIS